MHFTENEIYHVYNRGNNHQPIFFNHTNYLHFLKQVEINWLPHCEILAWCLMPNHFHFLIQATSISCTEIPAYGGKPMQLLARKIGQLLSHYAQFINRQNQTSGSLFQQKTKVKCVSDPGQTTLWRGPTIPTSSYIINCMHYIHQNPLKAGLVNQLEDWKYSSFLKYTDVLIHGICNKKKLFEFTGYDQPSFSKESHHIIEDSDMDFDP